MVRNKPSPGVFTANCPMHQVLDIVANKWSLIVIYALSFGTKRYSELENQIEGIF